MAPVDTTALKEAKLPVIWILGNFINHFFLFFLFQRNVRFENVQLK